jgi:hypothetical protein
VSCEGWRDAFTLVAIINRVPVVLSPERKENFPVDLWFCEEFLRVRRMARRKSAQAAYVTILPSCPSCYLFARLVPQASPRAKTQSTYMASVSSKLLTVSPVARHTATIIFLHVSVRYNSSMMCVYFVPGVRRYRIRLETRCRHAPEGSSFKPYQMDPP